MRTIRLIIAASFLAVAVGATPGSTAKAQSSVPADPVLIGVVGVAGVALILLLALDGDDDTDEAGPIPGQPPGISPS